MFVTATNNAALVSGWYPHTREKPLSTNRRAPLTKLASSDSRNSAACATSHLGRLAPAALRLRQARVRHVHAQLQQLPLLAQAVRRADEARTHRVGSHAPVAELHGDGASQLVARAIAGAVRHLAGGAELSADG